MIDSSVAQSRIHPAAVRRGAFMLPAPSGEQIKGLSVGDLVICLMCHRGAKNRDRLTRDRLWWEWVDVEGFTRDQASQRWRALPIATRAWIARRDEDAPKSDFDAPWFARRQGCSPNPQKPPDQSAARLRRRAHSPRGRSTYWRNLLFWNWRHASLFNETTWSIELWGLYESLSNQVRTSIDPQDKTLQRQEAGSRRQSCCLLSKTVCYYDKHLHASERERDAAGLFGSGSNRAEPRGQWLGEP